MAGTTGGRLALRTTMGMRSVVDSGTPVPLPSSVALISAT